MITSKENPHFKRLLRLHKKSERDETGLFLVEGERELGLAKEVVAIYYTSYLPLVNQLEKRGVDSFEMASDLFERIAYRKEGIIGICKMTLPPLKSFKEASLLLLSEGLEKPGNLGAMMRSCDGAGVSGLIVADPEIDPFNPNAIRASLGSFFTLPFTVVSSFDALNFLKENGFQIIIATPEAKCAYYEIDLTKPSCFVIGSEAFGVSKIWRGQGLQEVFLPMKGKVDSLNASVTAGILVYEALRQRSALSR